MKSVMKHQFSEVPRAEIPRSNFDRSHGFKCSFDAGWLVPCYVDEALPGDTFNLKMTGFARMATPIHPIMDNLYMDTFFFAVPNRLVWDNWQKFCGEQTDPGDSTDYTVPYITSYSAGYPNGHLFDYMGLPTQVPVSYAHNALYGRAYNLIYNEWFRDQNLQDSALVPTTDGPDAYSQYYLRRRGKRHDYFTSCLPWPQKGDSVDLPLGLTAPVIGIGSNSGSPSGGPLTGIRESTGTTADYDDYRRFDTDINYMKFSGPGANDYPAIYADLSQASAATINQLRQSFQIQKMLERDARGGTRYTEIIKSHFGVTSPDARLQRPEYLGGGSTPIVVTQVPQTAETGIWTPQGNLAAYATATLNNHGFTKSFTEHCTIIGLMSVRADLTYQQGLDRSMSRETRYDYFWPALAQIGEQAVLSKEIYLDGSANDEDVFGYQERYAEYRYKPSRIAGKLRSNDVASLDVWHLSQDFATRPVLSDTFIQETPPIDRVTAVAIEPDFIFDGYFSLQCARPMPVYGVPGLIDHF